MPSNRPSRNEIETAASRLFLEVSSDAKKLSGELFGGGPGLGARPMKKEDFVALWRKNWDTRGADWRADELDRFAPRDPKTGVRPTEGLKAFNALMTDAFPAGRPADPPKPPPGAPGDTPDFPPPPMGGPPPMDGSPMGGPPGDTPDFPPPPVGGPPPPGGTLSMPPPPPPPGPGTPPPPTP